jgi:hypothetical protein
MKGHFGAVVTTTLTAVALILALLQAVVLAHSAPKFVQATAARSGSSNRYSAPGGRSGVPYMPFDKGQQQATPPIDREGRTPQRPPEHRPPPPSRFRGYPPVPGPQPQRKLAA